MDVLMSQSEAALLPHGDFFFIIDESNNSAL